MSNTLHVFAPAKINLGLSVLGLLDNGYHALHSIMVALSIGDTLDITPAETLTVQVIGANLPTDSQNLVYRAAERYLAQAQMYYAEPIGAHIVLHKVLPLAAGLGGGSSDAASTLKALQQLYPVLSAEEVKHLACGLGADVPFFLHTGSALAEGIGEILSPFPLPTLHLVLINPDLAISAKDAYQWLDQQDTFSPHLPLDAILHALASEHPLPYFNTLQGPVLQHHSSLAKVLETLSDAHLHSPLMSGSGSTCFALAHSAIQAQEAAETLQKLHPAWWVRAVHSL